MKTLPLLLASFKSFIRNWKSVLLLIVFPLLLTYFLFSSMNPNNIERLPAGVYLDHTNFDLKPLTAYTHSYLYLKPYASMKSCMESVSDYSNYLCIVISGKNPYTFYVYFDPSRLITFNVVTGLHYAINQIKDKEATITTGNILQEIHNASSQVSYFNQELMTFNLQLSNYINQIDSNIVQLRNARDNLNSSMITMRSDIDNLQQTKNEISSSEEQYYNKLSFSLSNLRNYLTALLINNLSINEQMNDKFNEISNELYSSHEDFLNGMNRLQTKIDNYHNLNNQGFQYVNALNSEIIELQNTRAQLVQLQGKLNKDSSKLSQLNNNFEFLSNINENQIVNPILFESSQIYPFLPLVKSKRSTIERDAILSDPQKSFYMSSSLNRLNIFTNQRVFPVVFMLLLLFLSILVSSFVTLDYINSPARSRVALVKGTFLPELISIFLLSFIIVLIPMLIALFLGFYLFKIIFIFSQPISLVLVVFLAISIFVTFGILLSLLIKKESLTLLTNTFVMIFLMFISGLIIPVEKMRLFVMNLTKLAPGKLALDSLAQIIFYARPLAFKNLYIQLLMGWLMVLVLITIIVKKLRLTVEV